MFWLLGLAIALSSSSKLRIEQIGAGIGELALLMMILSAAYMASKRLRAQSDDTLRMFTRFWAISASCMVLGLFCRMFALQDPKWTSVVHDSLALLLAIGFSIALAFLLKPYREDFVEDMFAVVAAIALFEGALFVIGSLNQGMLPVPWGNGISLWYFNVIGVRFNGVCENPNQLALLLWGGPSVLAHATLTSTRGILRRGVYAVALAGCMVTGLATDSDALKAGWILQIVVYGTLELMRALRSRRKLPVALLLLLLGTGALGYLNPGKVAAFAVRKAEETYRDGDQGTTRLVLWREGSQAIIMSPVVGFGPGSVLTTFWNQQEAHNNFIDWALATGMAGSIAYLVLLGRILMRTWRGFSAFSGAMLLGVLASSAFGLSFRHPAYWFYLIVAAKMSSHAIWLQWRKARVAAWWTWRNRVLRELREASVRRPLAAVVTAATGRRGGGMLKNGEAAEVGANSVSTTNYVWNLRRV